jgi:ferritin
MIDPRIQDAINDQLNYELYSAYIYYSMESWFRHEGFNGFANWMAVQVKEEMGHAQIMFNFVTGRNGRVLFKAIDAPNNDWESPLHCFATAYEHEQIVTSRIDKIMDLAIEIKDHATAQWLQWFVAEQVEEEANTSEIANKLEWAKDAPAVLFQLDTEAAARVFTLPAPLATTAA